MFVIKIWEKGNLHKCPYIPGYCTRSVIFDCKDIMNPEYLVGYGLNGHSAESSIVVSKNSFWHFIGFVWVFIEWLDPMPFHIT